MTRRRSGENSARHAYVLVGIMATAGVLTGAAALSAQPVTGEIRVVERFDPVNDTRAHEVVRHLTPAEIRGVQAALEAVGHDLPRLTGRLDAPTSAALAAFQRSRGLRECGCVSYETVVALGLRPVVVLSVLAEDGGGDAATEPGDAVDGGYADVSVLYPIGVPVLLVPAHFPPRKPRPGPFPGEPGGPGEARDGVLVLPSAPGVRPGPPPRVAPMPEGPPAGEPHPIGRKP